MEIKNEGGFQKIYACSHIGEADIIISLFKRNGFNPPDLSTSALPGVMDDDSFYYVHIPNEEYDRARDFLISQGFGNII